MLLSPWQDDLVLDSTLRAHLGPALDGLGRRIAGWGVSANLMTLVGFVLGAGACLAAATARWQAALLLWIANRIFDGLDGPVARARGTSDRGGFMDIVADFTVYGGFVAGVGIAREEARVACLVLLLTYYVSGTAFLALSSIAERTKIYLGDERSLRFLGGLAESTETFIAYVLFCFFPDQAQPIAWVFAGAVAITAVQRVWFGMSTLRGRVRPP